MIEEQAKNRGISIDYELSEDVPPIQADEDRVKQVLLNLYLNALEAMSPGGTLKVRLDCHERDFVSVSISDTGKGIPERDLGHIFDPYFTKQNRGGNNVYDFTAPQLGGNHDEKKGNPCCGRRSCPSNHVA